MRKPNFFGEFQLRFDDRLRLLLPAEFRRQINPKLDGSFLLVIAGQNGRLWLYPGRYGQTPAAEFGRRPESADPDLALPNVDFSLATRTTLDNQGRVLLPRKMVGQFCLNRCVTLIGVSDHLEIWNPSKWDEYREGTARS